MVNWTAGKVLKFPIFGNRRQLHYKSHLKPVYPQAPHCDIVMRNRAA